MKQSPFRNLRQKLFHEGKLLRYLGYAIGEIVLIIIGIMMALQLNNWNEDRKAEAEFALYVEQLKEDVKAGMELLEREAESAGTKLERWVFLLRKLKGEVIQADEMANFERDLDSLGRVAEVDLDIGYLTGLLDGDLDPIVHDRELTLRTLTMTRLINGRLKLANDKVRIMHQVDNTIMKYRGRGMPRYGRSSSSDPLLFRVNYDLERLRSSPEFIYAVENATEAVAMFGRSLSLGRDGLEEFLGVLEEYE